ncbi:30S ribosomal protein S17e [Aeropyrum pernix K1]|uniref:Small ribosomal subunit protein eS17 n=1 Tax=Aeropyrum pernix (strain ATCC 700893 / DSM 11879 / JCM 9820 / NBRC 100138 / K1) TaxID=272557 RepID=RS17E_AERPE|nr:30S ribosomal protein S17e [Aeropyrum pernix]Q9YA67.1 RecName: Full=Small ribosomal subunit protein eS17; AltName: Full=30S ribosomal protein S17e [Aeropyrum pernix K1]BAA81082.1 30S ribosomal protein S17e [Aeropyrum pernix K1]
MGKVRIRLVKRTARKLLEKYPDLFTGDFEHNKRVVSQLIEYRSKKLRNQIAGYITHLVNMASKRKKAEEASARI